MYLYLIKMWSKIKANNRVGLTLDAVRIKPGSKIKYANFGGSNNKLTKVRF